MKCLRVIVGVLLLVAFDQYSKYMVSTHLDMHVYQPIFGEVFGLYYFENHGMAWGLLQGQQVIFLIFTIIVLAVSGYVYVRLLQDVYFRPLNVCIILSLSISRSLI